MGKEMSPVDEELYRNGDKSCRSIFIVHFINRTIANEHHFS